MKIADLKINGMINPLGYDFDRIGITFNLADTDMKKLRVDSALKAVGMYKHRGKEPHKLSGGQKQRVAIAGILRR